MLEHELFRNERDIKLFWRDQWSHPQIFWYHRKKKKKKKAISWNSLVNLNQNSPQIIFLGDKENDKNFNDLVNKTENFRWHKPSVGYLLDFSRGQSDNHSNILTRVATNLLTFDWPHMKVSRTCGASKLCSLAGLTLWLK